jgi:hypothetical protein
MNDLVANESDSAIDVGLRTRPVTSHSTRKVATKILPISVTPRRSLPKRAWFLDGANDNEQLFRTLDRHIRDEQYKENGDFQQEFLRRLEKARDGIAKANRMMSSDNGHLTLDEDLVQSDMTFFEDVFSLRWFERGFGTLSRKKKVPKHVKRGFAF